MRDARYAIRHKERMNILGIDWGEHDSAASLLQDGRLVAAAEEERFNRIKHVPFAFPLRAARYRLEAGASRRPTWTWLRSHSARRLAWGAHLARYGQFHGGGDFAPVDADEVASESIRRQVRRETYCVLRVA